MPSANLWQSDTDACCAARKVAPLADALAGKAAWITGLRRADSASRADAPIVHFDPFRDVTKINPMATWSDEDVARYNAHGAAPGAPARQARLRVDRLLAVHPPGRAG